MVALRYRDEHNKVGYLLKPTGSDDYHQIINFLRASHIRSHELGPPGIQATTDETPYTITEELVRSQLQLADDGGIDDLPIAEIYSVMDSLRYVTEGKLTFFKNKFSPQWRFLVHTILYCLSTKSGNRIIIDQMGLNDSPHEPLGGSFHMSPPRSTQASLADQTSGGVEDLITLTDLYFVVSTLVQKVNSLETKLKDHKKLFKDVVGKLVKKVKAMKVKFETMKRKMVVSDSDQEEGGKQDVDLDALLALANAAVTVDSNIPPGGASNNPAASISVLADVPTSVAPVGVSNKGKTLMVEEDITVKERTFKQMKDDRLGEQAAKRLHDEEQDQVDRQRAELQRRRQQEVLASTMYYTEADWINIMAQVKANASLSKTLMGDDVSEDNFPARMAALIKRKKQALAEKFMAQVKSFTDDQLQEDFEKIQKALSNIQIQAFSRTLKRAGPVLEEPSSKRQKSTEAPIPSVLEVPQSLVIYSPKSSGTRRKSLGRKRLTKPKSKLKGADDQTFIKEVITTPLGDINSLYRIDRSTAHFTTLREILHMVDRQDLLMLYGLVVKYYENHLVAGAGLILWGDLQVLFDFYEGDVSYPFSVKLMESMLKHKLEIDKDVVGNYMTTAEQLTQFIKNQLVAAQVSPA
nr:ribonuclease H-like domain-containing protein [Tanacetum cinerariifolium]